MSINGSVLGVTTVATGGAVLGVTTANGGSILPQTGSNILLLMSLAAVIVIVLGLLSRNKTEKFKEIE